MRGQLLKELVENKGLQVELQGGDWVGDVKGRQHLGVYHPKLTHLREAGRQGEGMPGGELMQRISASWGACRL